MNDASQDAIKKFNDGHLAAQVGKDRSEFQTDDPAANNGQGFRQ